MSEPPTRATTAGQLYLALQKEARAQRKSTDELLQLHALEAFVERLVRSRRSGDFVLKGGVLLSAYDVRRPTRDVDLSTQTLPNAPEALREVVAEVAREPVDDGWTFTATRAEPIREEDAYSGVRVSLQATLARARQELHVDVSFGDPVLPAPRTVRLRRVLGGVLDVVGYPLTMVLAEKVITAVQRGTVNTRWRDYADVYLLSEAHAIDGTELDASLRRVAEARAAELRALSLVTVGYPPLAQAKWAAWVRKQGLGERVPSEFATLLATVTAFADAALEGRVSGAVWQPQERRWNALPSP